VVKGEESLAGRLKELDEREDALELREAAAEADQEIAGDKLERRERELAEREHRVAQREASLETYVASTQSELQRRERALKST
jgi:hypothetical protein